MDFSQRLKRARMTAGLTQVELAQKLGVTSRSIQHYELGQRRPRKFETVEKLAEILNVEVNDLLIRKPFAHRRTGEGWTSRRDVEELSRCPHCLPAENLPKRRKTPLWRAYRSLLGREKVNKNTPRKSIAENAHNKLRYLLRGV